MPRAKSKAAKSKPAAKPSAETQRLAAEGTQKTDPDELRDVAAAQSEMRKAAVDGSLDEQPGATYADQPPENPVDREDVDADVPRPKVYSSSDLKGSKTKAARTATEAKVLSSNRQQGREPTATERKLADQGIIPPYR